MLKKTMKIYILIVSTIISFSSFAKEELKPTDLIWLGVFASAESEPDATYILMSNGFFQAPTSKNINELIANWLVKHPDAKIVKIVERSPAMDDKPNSKFIYFWVVNKRDNLNLHLIEKGALPAQTMLIAKTDKLLIPKENFDEFLKLTILASQKAISAKIGIYSEQ